MNCARPKSCLIAAATICALVPMAAPAAQPPGLADSFSLSDPARSPTGSLLGRESGRVRFDIKLMSLAADFAGSEEVASTTGSVPVDATAVRLYGSFREPLESDVSRRGGFGLSLQHRLEGGDRVALSAEYGTNVSPNLYSQDTSETRAVLSWTRAFGHRWQPSVTGSVFVGDEIARDDTYRQLGRRYMGVAVGGQVTLFSSHTPFLAFQMRRSYYDGSLGANGSGRISGATTAASGISTAEEALLAPRTDDRSMFTAGWRWQAGRDLSLQAEASYGLNADGQDLYNPERSRVFFGTRFDFR
jgi:hypothetical protein